MTLISILLGLALEYFLGSLDHVRNFVWFDQYGRWLERRGSRYSWWNGPVGVLVTLLFPVLALLAAGYLLGRASIILVFLLSVAVFVYCLGPDLNAILKHYIKSAKQHEETGEDDEVSVELDLRAESAQEGYDEEASIGAILFRSHENIFSILFWYIVLGMAGALLYRLVVRLENRYDGIHGGYAEAIRNLHRIMMWPSARVQAFSFGLGGSFMHAVESWRGVGGHTLDCSADVISHSGMGALQYEHTESGDEEADRAAHLEWINETRALINRTLLIWLTILGILTIGGFLH
jgi:AmpE protein